VRIRDGVALVAACLCLTGCSLFGKKSATPAAQRPPDSPVPQFPTRERPAADTVSAPSGVLAGQVIDRYNRRPGGVAIRVVDLEDTREPKAAPIEKQSDEQGYFTIAGLRSGGHYQLVARVQDGDRVLSGTVVARPPNPRLTIWVSEDTAGGAVAPPATPATVYPGRPDAGPRPAAALEAPVKDATPPAGPTGPANPGNGSNGAPAGSNQSPAAAGGAPDPTRTAGPAPQVKDGFQLSAPPAEPANVPGPPALPPPPGYPRGQDPPPGAALQRPGGLPPGNNTTQAPADATPVPACQLLGNKLINFALYDYNGRVWEYRKDRGGRGRPGRLVLIDFWHSRCAPCLRAMQYLVELDQRYRPYGLDLVGIAYESGTREQQIAQVLSVRGRYGIRYPTLLGAGSTCPVRSQFLVQAFPTLVLVDENGEIVLRKEGLSEQDFKELEHEIYRRLIR
jgi:thiol-disulfide isomerase/thioredoxin